MGTEQASNGSCHCPVSNFVQLKEFTYTASPDQICQVRLNRLVWSYEAEGPNGQVQEPLVCPEYVEHVGGIGCY